MASENPEKKKTFNRFIIFLLATGIFVIIILAQYISLMLVRHEKKTVPQLSNPLVERGPILDRNGRIFAIQTKLDSVTAWIPNIEAPEESASILASILSLDPEELVRKFSERTGFMYIKRKISLSESKKITEAKELGKLKGISLEPEYGRNYPEKELASQLIGYVGTDNTGLAGIEYSLNSELSPKKANEDSEIVYGNQVFLTIDMNIQYMTEKIAARLMEEQDPDSVMILVLDAKNGDFLASASLPSFDPNFFNRYPESVRKNRPAVYAYEPGSVFKVFSLASFLELKGIRENDFFYCDGYYQLDYPGGKQERITCLGRHGNVNVQRIIQVSCNAGAAYASETVDGQSFYQMLRLFGFGEPVGLPSPGESFGLIQAPEEWSLRSKPTIAFGQELSVSAVQMASGATVFANAGTLLKTHLVKKIVSPEGKILSEIAREPLRQVLSPESARALLLDMETATAEEGTATRAAVQGIRISAKTGTAQMLDRATGTYSESSFIASCLAVFPTDNPQVILYVVIDNPKMGETYGGRIAAPVIHDLAEELIPYLNIPREGETLAEHEGKLTVRKSAPLVLGDTMPDLLGLSKRQILSLFYQKQIQITIEGSGWVVRQTPEPGTPVTDGMSIRLELQ